MTEAKVQGDACLNLETLAALIDGRLEANARRECEAHLADCYDCHEMFIGSFRNRDNLAGADIVPVPPLDASLQRSRRRWSYGAAVAVAAMVTFVVMIGGRWLIGTSDVTSAMRDLVASGGPYRGTLPRLAAPFPWAPAPRIERGNTESNELPPATIIAAARLAQALQKDRRPETLQAFATAQLVLGRTDSALAALEEASQAAPDTPGIWLDLSAVHFARAARPEGALSLPKGLEAANTAIALGGVDGPAWFNKALLLERLNARDQANDAWKRYLEIDGQSSWAQEARERLAALKERSALTRPADAQADRETLLDTVLPQWGDAVNGHDTEKTRVAWSDAQQRASALARASGDQLATAVIAAIQRSRGAAREQIILGHVAYGAARARYKIDDFDGARPLFAKATQHFAAAGSPAVHSARLYAAIVEYRFQQHAAAIAALRALRTQTARYPSVAGRAAWVEGLALEVLGFPRDATACYLAATPLLREAGEVNNAAFVEGLLASQFDRLGHPDRAWATWVKTLEDTAREAILLNASISATRFGWHRTALDLQIAATAAARAAGRVTAVADGLRWQAISNIRLGQDENARQRIREARATAAGRSGAAWDRMQAEIDVAEAEAGDGPAARAAAATRALAYFERAKSPVRLPELLLARAMARQSAGDTTAAYADVTQGLRVLIELRDHVAPGIDQVRFSDVVRRLVGTLVDFEERRGRLREAFDTVDEARARDLPDVSSPITLATLEQQMPPNAVLASFVIGDVRSYVWIVRAGTSTVAHIEAGAAAIAQLGTAAGAPRFDRNAARELARLVLAPVLRHVPSEALLIVVPDGPLHGVPFAALPGARTTYLIEEHPIVVSPSARTWLRAANRLSGQTDAPVRAFVAGNPRIDIERYGNLPNLPSATVEARAIATLYGTTALIDEAVTRRAVLDGLDAQVVHFAGHALVNEVEPSASALVVWDPDGPGLSAASIRARTCERTRLVVLAACHGSAGPVARAEGAISLARAFLAAGVPTVVASHWAVEDRAASELFVTFHETYRATGDAARALREAQLRFLQSSDDTLREPGKWAGFVVFGTTPISSR